MQKKKVKKAVFPVGGLGTRFLPATKAMPKEMLPVGGKPMIQHAFEEARDAGIEQFIFITGRNKNVMNNHFDHSYELQNVLNDHQKDVELSMVSKWLPEAGNIIFIRQQEPLGLGHAVWCARNVINDEPFVVLLADEMVKSNLNVTKLMLDEYYQSDAENIVCTYPVVESQKFKYGIVEVSDTEAPMSPITHMIEKPSLLQTDSNLSMIGKYVLSSKIFDYLEKSKKGKGGEIQLTDTMLSMIKDGMNFSSLQVHGERHDCGSYVGFLRANIAYALDNPNIKDAVKEMLEEYLK